MTSMSGPCLSVATWRLGHQVAFASTMDSASACSDAPFVAFEAGTGPQIRWTTHIHNCNAEIGNAAGDAAGSEFDFMLDNSNDASLPICFTPMDARSDRICVHAARLLAAERITVQGRHARKRRLDEYLDIIDEKRGELPEILYRSQRAASADDELWQAFVAFGDKGPAVTACTRVATNTGTVAVQPVISCAGTSCKAGCKREPTSCKQEQTEHREQSKPRGACMCSQCLLWGLMEHSMPADRAWDDYESALIIIREIRKMIRNDAAATRRARLELLFEMQLSEADLEKLIK